MLRLLRRLCFLYFILVFVQKGDGVKLSKAAANWAISVVKDTGKVSNLDEAEPGFDLNEDDRAKFHIWPAGVIPYYIDDFSFDKVLRDRIRSFLDHTNGVSGLQFMEIPLPPIDETYRWVLFINRQGQLFCSDYPFSYFTDKGVQKVVLGYNCLGSGRQLPAIILSLVGVPPQHNAPNRDTYVEIHTDNILPDKLHLFEKLKDDMWLFHDVEYDFDSAGHYSPEKYTANGAATVEPRQDITDIEVGDGKSYSYNDIWKLRMLYNYIRKHKVKEVKENGCKKLFDRGSNFSNYQPESENEIEPRKKPAKYIKPDSITEKATEKNPHDKKEKNNNLSSLSDCDTDDPNKSLKKRF